MLHTGLNLQYAFRNLRVTYTCILHHPYPNLQYTEVVAILCILRRFKYADFLILCFFSF